MKSKGYLIKKTELKGVGVFATKPFRIGEIVIHGKIIKRLKQNTSHASQIGLNIFVLHNKAVRKVNHSCSPNCGIRINESKAHDYIAIKEIQKGDEITFDYAMRNYTIDYFPEKCHCGSIECRVKITGWKDLSIEKKNEYANFIPEYLSELNI